MKLELKFAKDSYYNSLMLQHTAANTCTHPHTCADPCTPAHTCAHPHTFVLFESFVSFANKLKTKLNIGKVLKKSSRRKKERRKK